ncbi:MAG: UbiA family prenyltransferase [Gemmatimonadota bacterium]
MLAPSPRAVKSGLRLVRWANALTAAAGVLAGAWWAGWGDSARIVLAAVAAVGLTAAANGWNDLADVDIDRVAHPDRPLVTGTLSPASADRIAMFAGTGAVLAASMVSTLLGMCSVGVLLLMRLYSPWIKRVGLAGNLVVSVLASLPFLYGSYAAGQWHRGVPLVLTAIPLHLARELAKDLDDRDADLGARRTIPIVLGAPFARAAILVALVASGVALALGLAPLVRSPALLLAALIPAMVALALATVRAIRGRPGSPGFFKLAMACAMGALLVARA